jgi:hypothetical protein
LLHLIVAKVREEYRRTRHGAGRRFLLTGRTGCGQMTYQTYRRRMVSPLPDDAPGGSPGDAPRWRSVIAIVVVIMLIGVGLFVWTHVARMAAIQDCVASGRTNCMPISVPVR